jgi:hypothetical protein
MRLKDLLEQGFPYNTSMPKKIYVIYVIWCMGVI